MVSTKFINECKNRTNANRLGQIIVDGIDTPITNSNSLQSFEINSGCYVNGDIVGSVYAKCLKANFISDQNNLNDKIIHAKIGVKYDDLSTEYINMGKYRVERPNNEITAQYSQITAYDSLYTNLDNSYVCGIDYFEDNKTLKDLYADVCKQLELTPKTLNIPNGDIPIKNNPFTNNEKNRTVLQTVCKVAGSFVDIDNDEDTIDLCWLSNSEEPDYIFYKNDYVSVEGGQVVCGPINCLIIKNSTVDSENVTIKDDDSIALYGEHSMTISEDYILHNAELRQQAINSIWDKVKGMKYVDCKLTTDYGKPFLKMGTYIRIYTSETEYFDTYVLSHKFTYDGTFGSVIESKALTTQEIQAKQNVDLGKLLSLTQIDVNKQKQEILLMSQKQISTSNEVNQVGIATLENCMATSLYKLSLKGDLIRQYNVINADNTSYPVYFDVYLVVESGENKDRYKLPLDHLSHLNDVYDEFLIEDGNVKFIQRIGTKGNKKYILSNPIETDLGTIDIKLYKGTNKIYLESFDTLLVNAKYLIENPYTKEFATKAELSGEIIVRADEVAMLAKTKLNNDEYTGAKIVAKINGAKGVALIDADVINLTANDILNLIAGNTINLTSKNITISSDNFNVDKNGKVIMNDAQIKGGSVAIETDNFVSDTSAFKLINKNNKSEFVAMSPIGLQFIRNGNELFAVYCYDDRDPKFIMSNPAGGNSQVSTKYDEIKVCKYSENSYTQTIITADNVTTPALIQTSKVENKKNFEKYDNALDEIKKIDIYKYNLKNEDDNHKKHLGFVIGENYNYSHEITAVNGNGEEIGVDNYSMTSLCLQAIKEQQLVIEKLKEEIELLKNKEVDENEKN